MELSAAMKHAVELARESPDTRPNPRVGCVLLSNSGELIAEGAHQGAGQPHAEVEALARAGDRAAGATAVVTLEPCNHRGRTGPCSQALIEAGVSRVVFGQRDPNLEAAGGANRLQEAGVAVEFLESQEAKQLNREWTFAMKHGRPFVIWKVAATLDGRIAAADGTSRWITGPEARADSHQLRGEVDAILVGSRTVQIDDPRLTARLEGAQQPLRVVMGKSDVPEDAKIRLADPASAFRHLQTRDPRQALAGLLAQDVHYVLLEGGAQLVAAFVSADLVDAIRWYAAPKLLGAGPAALANINATSITDAREWQVAAIRQLGPDLRIDLSKIDLSKVTTSP